MVTVSNIALACFVACVTQIMRLILTVQLSAALFALSTLAGWAQAVNPVVVKGREFVDTVTNKRVQIIGVEYVETNQEPLKQCRIMITTESCGANADFFIMI